MRKKKIIVLLSILFILAISIFVFLIMFKDNEQQENFNSGINQESAIIKDDSSKVISNEENIPEKETIKESVSTEEPTTKKDEVSKESPTSNKSESSTKKENTKENSSNSNTESKSEVKQENKVETNNNDNKNDSNNSNTSSSSNNNTTTNNDNKDKVWEQLGMSESDYYNKPIWSWAKVTHSNLESCKADGIKAQQEELNKNSGKAVLYTCHHLYSHSGKYLGEMLEIEYLG